MPSQASLQECKGDLTQIEDRQYTMGRARDSTVSRPQMKGCRQPRKLKEARAGRLLEDPEEACPRPCRHFRF